MPPECHKLMLRVTDSNICHCEDIRQKQLIETIEKDKLSKNYILVQKKKYQGHYSIVFVALKPSTHKPNVDWFNKKRPAFSL